jgi:hypothetical protein
VDRSGERRPGRLGDYPLYFETPTMKVASEIAETAGHPLSHKEKRKQGQGI